MKVFFDFFVRLSTKTKTQQVFSNAFEFLREHFVRSLEYFELFVRLNLSRSKKKGYGFLTNFDDASQHMVSENREHLEFVFSLRTSPKVECNSSMLGLNM